jgi:peptidoglycan/xylan/chitin deacetylase (PgdA/CDA1 family)
MRVGLASVVLGLLLAASSAHAQSIPVSDREILRGDPDVPAVALVFNVGAGFTPSTSLLDTLAEKEYRATFFVMGWWAERHPDLLARIANAGHEIASHGHSIFDLTLASEAAIRTDLQAADDAISAVTGRSTRPLWSPSAGYRDARVRSIAASMGFRPILWTIDSSDWTYEATSESVYSKVINGVVNGAIVVMHFDSPTTDASTAQVLPSLVDHLREAGFRLVTITELLNP